MKILRLAKIGYRLAELTQQQCMLCLYSCRRPPCEHCRQAIRQFPHDAFDYNLMRWPKVASALKPYSFQCVHAIGEYEYPLSKLIADLKYNRKLASAEALANCFCDSIRERKQALPQCILPTPLHGQRYLSRPFNQAVEIAVAVAEQLNMTCDLSALQRVQSTRAQITLGRNQRLQNVTDAFSCNKLADNVSHVAIFDDVITTGATMHAMREAVLKNNPNLHVEVWSISIALASLD